MAKRFITPFAEAGDRATMPDTPTGTDSNYQTGYTPEYEEDPVTNPATAKFVERDKSNQLYNDITANIKEWQEHGFPAFITSANNGGVPFSYNKNSIVTYLGVDYQSKVSGNTDVPPSAKWEVLYMSQAYVFLTEAAMAASVIPFALNKPLSVQDENNSFSNYIVKSSGDDELGDVLLSTGLWAVKLHKNNSKWDQEGFNASGSVADAPNVIAGHSKNSIVSDTHSCVIGGGGLENRENVIGGLASSVNNPSVSNLNPVPVLGTQSQFCMIGGGYDNVVNGLANVIPVGQHCLVDILADHGTVTGGSVNWILEGSYNGIYAGTRNTIGLDSGGLSLIAGGGDNVIDGVGSHVFIGAGSFCESHGAEFSVITGGLQNVLNGCSGSAITGGNGNEIQLGNSTIAGGNGNEIIGAGQGCFIGAGINNKVSGENSVGTGRENETTFNYSQVSGYRAKATRNGERTRSDDYFTEVGDAKSSKIILKKTVTSASEVVLEDVNGGSSFPVKTNRLIGFTVKIIGHRTDVVGDNVMIILQGMAHRATSGAHTINSLADQIVSVAGSSTWTARFFDSTGSLRVGVTGEAAKTINWMAEVEWLETFGA